MPPKSSSKKSGVATWFHCEACDAHITSKERETHEKACPIGEDAAKSAAGEPLEYIRDGCLYTSTVERRAFSVDELQDMPEKYVNNLIFISEGAMRLAGFHIGQQVAIRAHAQPESVVLVRAIWPIPEKFLTTLFITEDDLNLYWAPLRGDVVKIQALPNDCVSPAKTMRLQLQTDHQKSSELSAAQLRDVERILKQELRQLIFKQGSLIYTNFFNKPLKFLVTVLNGFEVEEGEDRETENLLEHAFEKLCLSRTKNEGFFKISYTTCVEVEATKSQSADESAEENQILITKLDIGGLDKQLCLIEESMELALGFRKVPKGVKISRGLLLYGSTGCGKTMICEAMSAAVQQKCAAEFKTQTTHVIKVNSSELFSRYLGETEKNLAAYFEKAYANYPQPTLIVIEELHSLCPKHETNDMVKRVSGALLSMLDALSSSSRRDAQRVFILATTSQIEGLNASARRCGRFDCEVEIGVPTPKGRAEILRCLLRPIEHDLSAAQLEEVAQVTHGFVGADLANLVSNAALSALKAANGQLSAKDLHASLLHVKPSAMREVLIECPNVHWSDIGGQAELKLKLKQAIEWPLLHPEKFARLGIKPPRGILMFGPPGCSKTMIAKALATESQLNFLSIKGPELFSMWVGESERAVREVFRKARQVAPSIVFFDEIDAIGGERAESGSAGSGSSVKERVLTQLLTELDGVETLQNVTIVAATNRPDMIDAALLRPGRIDRIVYVGLPDEKARREIFRIKLRKMPLAADVNLDALVERSAGYSGAEIQAVCHEAALKTLEQSFESEHVTWQEFEYALGAVQPRTSSELLKLYEEYLKKS